MELNQSHGRLIRVIAVVAVPVLLSFSLGYWVSQEIFKPPSSGSSSGPGHLKYEDEQRLKQISVQAHLMLDLFLTELESLKVEVSSLALRSAAQVGKPSVAPVGRILYWAELNVHQGSIQSATRWARNPLWNATVFQENFYLNWATQNLDLHAIESHGVHVLRLRQDPSTTGEWMSLAFQFDGLDQVHGTDQDKKILLVLIEPARAFHLFQNWAVHSSGGKSRSYLIGNDGRVLSHSQEALVYSDFSKTPLFQQALQKVVQGAWISGSGDSIGIDQVPIGAAYYRIGQLPLAIVVEEVNSSQFTHIHEYQALAMVMMGLFLAGLATWLCSVVLTRCLVKVVTFTVQAEAPSDAVIEKPQGSKFFAGHDFLILDSAKSLEKNMRNDV